MAPLNERFAMLNGYRPGLGLKGEERQFEAVQLILHTRTKLTPESADWEDGEKLKVPSGKTGQAL